jgi:hypothetical protein
MEKGKVMKKKAKIDRKSRQLTISAFCLGKYGKVSKQVKYDEKGSKKAEKGQNG